MKGGREHAVSIRGHRCSDGAGAVAPIWAARSAIGQSESVIAVLEVGAS